MADSCLICQRITTIKNGNNPHLVCTLKASYVVLGDSQFYKGYTLLLSKEHHTELHQLEADIKWQYLKEMTVVAEAVQNVFQPIKLNYELLGNRHAHLHWHIIPRHQDDPNIHNPIWIIDKNIRNDAQFCLKKEALEIRKESLRNEIMNLLK